MFGDNPKFKNKYLIASARMRGYDYAQNGAYFVTICADNRQSFFGEIVESGCNPCEYQMQLSEIGKIVIQEWEKTAEIRKNVELGESVVMPNHFHGIVILHSDDSGGGSEPNLP